MTRNLIGAVVMAAALCVLHARSVQAQGSLDHLLCYKMEDPLQIRTAVDMIAELQPEFSQQGCVLLKPVEFCVPASKTNVQPPPPNPNIVGQPLQDDYICYLSRCPDQPLPADKLVVDQFGRRIERHYRPAKVCVPARKRPVLCGSTGIHTCGGLCLDPTQDCRTSPTDAGCVCVPKECGGHVDSSGNCGGACPSGESCLPDAAGACMCQPPPPPPCQANSAAANGCGGSCPNAAEQCFPDANGNCACQPPPSTCGRIPGSTECSGDCTDPTTQCLPDASGGCSCQPPPSPCGRIPGSTECSGECTDPATQCLPDASGGGCSCQPPPSCSLISGTQQCTTSGCPAGTTCRFCDSCPAPQCTCQ